jgi:hypothetical protein
MRESRWSRLVCFAGVGPGEVLVGERKVVGMSQRRTRDGARFQCVVHRSWDAEPLLDLLVLEPDDRAAAGADLAVAGAGVALDPSRVIDALVNRLPP